jgi:restriction endonuclease S subunit
MSGVEMKESGVAWLGEIPRHWDVKPLKAVISQVMNGAWGSDDNSPQKTLVPGIVLRGTDFPEARLGSVSSAPLRFIDQHEVDKKALKLGDIVVEISGGSDTQATGRILLISHELISNATTPLLCTNFCKALRLSIDTVSPPFFSKYWRSLYELGRPFIYEKRTTGIRNFQYKDFVANESILLPPLHEQRAIAAYLDAETARIDRLIDKTERLTALLREKRVALISQAVTKGLAAGVEMKASGVEWLGEIPSHWGVKPAYSLTLATDKRDPSQEPGTQFRYIDVSSISRKLHQITVFEQLMGYDAPTRARNVVLEGDTIFATVRPYLRNIALIPIELHNSICSTGFCVLRADRAKLDSRNLFYSCISVGFVASVEAHQQGVSYPAVSDRVVRRQVIPLPPLAEQCAIASYLDRETAKIDRLIDKNDQLIALLREKRSALISAAVTGKIEVDLTPPPTPPGA